MLFFKVCMGSQKKLLTEILTWILIPKDFKKAFKNAKNIMNLSFYVYLPFQ